MDLVRGAGITADQILGILRDLRGKTAGLPVDQLYQVMRADPMNVEQYQDEPHFETLKSFVDWDFSSFDPSYETEPLEQFEPLVREVCLRPPRNR